MTVLTTICAVVVVVEAYHTVQDDDSDSTLHRLWKAVLHEKFTFVFGTFTLLCAWSLTSLLCFHAMIISVAQTTNERVRGVYRFGQVDNDADRGCCTNWYTACCWPYPVSRLPKDMSEMVICEYTEPEEVWTGIDGENEDGEHGGENNNGAAAEKSEAMTLPQSNNNTGAIEGSSPPRVQKSDDALPPATV